MLCRLTGQSAILLDFPAEPQWSSAAGQQFGSATIRIMRDSIAWSEDILNERGGALVEIFSGVGIWQGIGETPVFHTWGVEVRCLHLNAWARIRHVGKRTFHGVTGGVIARRAVQDALIGLGSVPITIGPVLQAPPILSVYEFKQQTLLSVLTDLQNQTGQVWSLERFIFAWRSQIGRYQELTLVDDGRYLDRLQRQPLADQHRETIEIEPSGRTFTAYDGGVPALWPSQRIVRV